MARGKAASHPAPIEPEEESQEMPEVEEDGEPEVAGRKGKITKSHAVRVALAEGYENPTKAVEFIKKRFGIEMVAQHFSSIKSQEKKKTDPPAVRGEPEAAKRKPAATKPDLQSSAGRLGVPHPDGFGS